MHFCHLLIYLVEDLIQGDCFFSLIIYKTKGSRQTVQTENRVYTVCCADMHMKSKDLLSRILVETVSVFVFKVPLLKALKMISSSHN